MSDEPEETNTNTDPTPEVDNCNLIVNYLPLSYRERHLLKLFSQIGEIKSCRVMRFVQDGRTLSKGYGFVKFSKLEEAQKAIEILNGKNVLGKQIKVSFARPNSQRTKSNLFISQIPKEWSDVELKHQFSAYGKIIESRVLRTEKKESRRCGFVRFDNNEQAQLAMEKMNGVCPTPFDVPIRVRVATQHEKNKVKQEDSDSSSSHTHRQKRDDDTRSEITSATNLTYQSEISAATSHSRRQILHPAPELMHPMHRPHHPSAPSSVASGDYRHHPHLETAPMRPEHAFNRRDPARGEYYGHGPHGSPTYGSTRRSESMASHRAPSVASSTTSSRRPARSTTSSRHHPMSSPHHSSGHHHPSQPAHFPHGSPYRPSNSMPSQPPRSHHPSYSYDHHPTTTPPRGYYPPTEPSYSYDRRGPSDFMMYEHEMMMDNYDERPPRFDHHGYGSVPPSSMLYESRAPPAGRGYSMDPPLDYPPMRSPESAHESSGQTHTEHTSPATSHHTYNTAKTGRSPSASPHRHISNESQPLAPHTKDIHIVGLPKNIGDSELRERLKEYGDLEYVQIPKDRNNRGLGMAYASYVDARSAQIAIKELDQSFIGTHRISLSLA